MSSATFLTKHSQGLAITAWLITLPVCAGLTILYFTIPQAPSQSFTEQLDHQPEIKWGGTPAISPDAFSVLQPGQGGASTINTDGLLSKRFRFAGTFFDYGSDTRRRAVLDDLEKKKDHLVAEGDFIDDIEVLNIYKEEIVLRYLGKNEHLYRRSGFRESSLNAQESNSDTNNLTIVDLNDGKLRFGNRVGQNVWNLSRDEVMKYYNEVMREPERLLKVFDSMKPLYNENQAITGYVLDVEGEKAFFDAIGFKQGDQVLRVNGAKMNSRYKAEHLISEFAQDRLNLIFIDMQRDGKPVQLRYRFF